MEYIEKEVYFYKYCPTCKNYSKEEEEEPCWKCLNETTNTHSHKPVYWEEDK